MILKIYSVYDSKVESFLPPLFFKTKGEFIRSFTEACNDPKSNIGKYPSDYTAFELGSWDDSNGQFELHLTPISIGLAQEFVRGSA